LVISHWSLVIGTKDKGQKTKDKGQKTKDKQQTDETARTAV
jgi:hypothetical protein